MEKLAMVRHIQGRLIARMEGLGFALQEQAVLQSLTEEVVLNVRFKDLKARFQQFYLKLNFGKNTKAKNLTNAKEKLLINYWMALKAI